MKVLFLTKYGSEGPSSRYRFYNYIPYLDEAGISYFFEPLLNNRYIFYLYSKQKIKALFLSLFSVLKRILFLLFSSKKYDLIIIEKELFPNMPYFIESFLLRSKRYALDFDDYIAASYKENKYKRFFLENKIQKLVTNAKFVTVGNHWYFEEFKTKNLHYLPTVINIENYSEEKQSSKVDTVTIAWIGSPTTAQYLKLVVSALRKLAKKYPIKLKIIGAHFEIEDVDVELVKWDSKTEFSELLSSDIGIMPLKRTMWENGKCGFKLIQYMASGLPVVATTAPANEEIIDDNRNGFLIYNDEEWYDKLEGLIVNKTLREQFGKLGRIKIKSDYTYQVWGNRYVNIIKNA